ncbi:unnamed protein product [Mycena citricolor]|uniref:Uncharacterized protein n=1 Tax=Mycena citricolor TaxID=2018698 RepID=A0AAD2HAQ0_9AGAR|nr:unnamed protein product [Mycena citricolor]
MGNVRNPMMIEDIDKGATFSIHWRSPRSIIVSCSPLKLKSRRNKGGLWRRGRVEECSSHRIGMVTTNSRQKRLTR